MSVGMPGIIDEYRRIAAGAGWSERADRGRIRLEGADAGPFLQALVTNDVARLGPGDGVYSAYLTPNGRMLADLEIYRLGDGWLVSLCGSRAAAIAARLDESVFSEDVRVSNVSGALAEMLVVGGGAADALARALPAPADRLAALPELGHLAWEDGVIARAGDARLPAFRIFVPSARLGDVGGRLDRAGLAPMSDALVEALRIDRGRPRFGADMTEETIPLEAGLLDRAISTTKGCYVGQEIIIRVLHRGGGRVAKRLVTLALDAGATGAPPPGTPLVAGGKPTGHITSVAPSPTTGGLIALGYVHRDLAGTGQRVLVGDTGVTAEVTGLAG